MKRKPEHRYDVPSEEILDELVRAPLVRGLRVAAVSRTFHRDVYFDTLDRALGKRGVTCRFRTRSDDRRFLSVRLRETQGGAVVTHSDHVVTAAVRATDPYDAIHSDTEPARRLRAVIGLDRLHSVLELETERIVRRVRSRVLPWTKFELVYDVVTVRHGDRADSFREIKVRPVGRRARGLEDVVLALQEAHGLRTILSTKVERAQKLLKALETDVLSEAVRTNREVALVAIENRKLALLSGGNRLSLPVMRGSGEATCRDLMRSSLATSEGRVRLLGTAPAAGTRPVLEVWLLAGLPDGISERADKAVQWITLDEILVRVGSPALRDAPTLAALAVVGRSDLVPERSSGVHDADPFSSGPTTPAPTREIATLGDLQRPELPQSSLDAGQPVPDQFVNEQLSWLEFNARVLALAEDPGTPLLARLNFLSIFSANLDEFFMVRVAILKHAVAEGVSETSIDGLTPPQELDAILIRVAPLVARQQRCYRKIRPDLERNGIRICGWDDLGETAREWARRFFDEQIFPVLTPQAMTRAPGHPFPHLANLSLSLAVMVRDPGGGPIHFAHIKLPAGLRRFVQLPGDTHFVRIEDLIANNLHAVYPDRIVEEAHAFRITRSGDITIDEQGTSSLLRAVEEEVKRRPFGAVVRIEVDGRMPQTMRDMLQRELRFEDADHVSTLTNADVVAAPESIDLGSLGELAELPFPELQYPPFHGATPFDPHRSMFDIINAGDVLVHHPYDSFDGTVQRLIVEASGDPNVVAIKMTLYRGGSQSTIVDALTRAAAAGKDVSVFVELKARFDEERNIHWAKTLERAGIHVITGLVRLKTHAKTILVVRREGHAVRRYVHVGTGNYNASTAKLYTDLGVLSCNEELGVDLNNLFNEFTGASRPPQSHFRHLIVSPTGMLDRFVGMIDREADHARAGRGGRVRIKLNGLADQDIIAALYRASQAGVEIDLIVRGICSLRPGVQGLSERIRVFSLLGRFLEHARIYHFGNGGDDEYFIGSADWRPRNLRRRVEVVAPVIDPGACRRLDEILELELEDPLAWQMRSDGGYSRAPAPVGIDRLSAQERLVARLTARNETTPSSPFPEGDDAG